MRRVLALLLVALLGAGLLYISRYWPVRLWDRPGLFGLRELPPQGGLLRGWLRGTPLAPFELLIWALMVFGVLSVAQWLVSRRGD
ncbi:MAG: hypothetical protein AAGF60_04395 [Pseudomonadota bacterium]